MIHPLRLRPPKTKSSPAKHPLCYTRLHLQKTDSPHSISLIRRALARKYSTKGPSQSTTINQVAYYSVANPVEYPQEKALLPSPLNKCPPPQTTSTTRQTEQVDERSKEINPLHTTHTQIASN